MTNKKSLYQILEVANDATYAEIRASHQRLLQSLDSQQSSLSREDYNNQMRLLRVAFSTLSTPMSRDSYDAHLSIRKESAKPQSAALVTTAPADQGAAAVRAEALLMRADAMNLRAEAMGLKADLLSGQPLPSAGQSAHPMVGQLLTSSRTVLLTLGTLVAIGMVFKVAFMVTRGVQSDQEVNVRSLSEDKVFLQDYYQTWGVRPASRAEAELLDAERRKNEDAKREQRQLDDAKRNAAQAEHRFEVESRRRGEQVSAELQYAEDKARQAALQEDRQKEYMRAEAERQRQESERRRVEAEQAKWQRILEAPAKN